MFKHCGRRLGHGAVGAAELADVGVPAVDPAPPALPVGAAEAVLEPSAAVTGQMVVETGTTTVVTTTDSAGQLVTVGAQLMMVETEVV